MAAWFIEHLLPAKKMYMTIVIAKLAKYIVAVDPTNMNCQPLDSVASILSRQCSAQVCAKSTNKINPSRRNIIAPTSAT